MSICISKKPEIPHTKIDEVINKDNQIKEINKKIRSLKSNIYISDPKKFLSKAKFDRNIVLVSLGIASIGLLVFSAILAPFNVVLAATAAFLAAGALLGFFATFYLSNWIISEKSAILENKQKELTNLINELNLETKERDEKFNHLKNDLLPQYIESK